MPDDAPVTSTVSDNDASDEDITGRMDGEMKYTEAFGPNGGFILNNVTQGTGKAKPTVRCSAGPVHRHRLSSIHLCDSSRAIGSSFLDRYPSLAQMYSGLPVRH